MPPPVPPVQGTRKTQAKKVTKVWSFPRTMPYNEIMKALKEEFSAKWNDRQPSPLGGLDDHDQLSVLGAGAFGTVVSDSVFGITKVVFKIIINYRDFANIRQTMKWLLLSIC